MHAFAASLGWPGIPAAQSARALYQCAARHAPELRAGDRFRRRVEENVIERFLECGDPRYGFARIYWDKQGETTVLVRTGTGLKAFELIGKLLKLSARRVVNAGRAGRSVDRRREGHRDR